MSFKSFSFFKKNESEVVEWNGPAGLSRFEIISGDLLGSGCVGPA